MGGTALSTVYNQIGNEAPDMDDPAMFKSCFECVQVLVKAKLLLAGHDRSDGGLGVTLLEMAFAGNVGFDVTLPASTTPTTILLLPPIPPTTSTSSTALMKQLGIVDVM